MNGFVRPALSLFALALVSAACTESRSVAPEVSPASRLVPAPDARAPALAGADAAAPGAAAQTATAHDAPLPKFDAWTDPAAVDALLAGATPPDDGKDPRSCGFDVPEQSCIPGPEGMMWACRSDCARVCTNCTTPCTTAMGACRAKCAAGDAACARACAATAGACLQVCLAARDRCATGDCAKQVDDYVREISSNYGCKPKRSALDICKRTVACMAKCEASTRTEAAAEACRAACKKTLAPGCHAEFLQNVDMGSCFPYEDPI